MRFVSWWLRVLEHAKFVVACLLYGEHCVFLTSVHECQKRFCEGRTSLKDEERGNERERESARETERDRQVFYDFIYTIN